MKLHRLLPWQRTLWGAAIAQVLSLIAFQAGFVLIPYYIQELGISDVNEVARWTGAYQSIGSVAFAVFTPVWGALGDRYGRKANLVRATVGTAVMMAATAFVRTPVQLLILRFFQGMVTGTPSAASVLVAASVPRKKVAFALGLLQTAFFIGISIGPMFGGWVGDAIGYRQTFLLSSLIVVLAVVAAIVGTTEPERDAAELEAAAKPGSRNPLAGFGELFRNPVLAGLVLVNLTMSLTLSLISPALPILIQQIVAPGTQPASVAGTVTGVGAITAAAAAMAAGRLAEHLGNRRTSLLGMVGTALLYIPMGLAQTPLLLIVGSAAQGLFRGGIGPSLSAMLVASVPKDRTGVALGLNTSAGSVGFALGPMLGALMVSGWSTRVPFFASTALFVVVCVIASLAMKRAEAAEAVA